MSVTRIELRRALERRFRDEANERLTTEDFDGAINDAINEAWPMWHDVVEDTSLIVIDGVLMYSLPATVNRVLTVELENATIETTGTAEAGGAATLTDSDVSWDTDEWVDYEVVIVDGTGAGQARTISGNTATVLTVSSAWATNPDDTSEYVIKDLSDRNPWKRLRHWRVRGVPGVYQLELFYIYTSGQRLRVIYARPPAELATDNDATEVPKAFILLMALAALHEQFMEGSAGGQRSVEKHEFLATRYLERAEVYRRRSGRRFPTTTVHGPPIDGVGL